MVEFIESVRIVADILREYIALVALALVFGSIMLWKRYKGYITRKVPKSVEVKTGEVDTFTKMYKPTPEKSEEDGNIIEELEHVTNSIRNDEIKITKEINNQFYDLKLQLRNVNKIKEDIHTYGLELGKLYEKYQLKENQIVRSMEEVEKIIPKQAEQTEK